MLPAALMHLADHMRPGDQVFVTTGLVFILVSITILSIIEAFEFSNIPTAWLLAKKWYVPTKLKCHEKLIQIGSKLGSFKFQSKSWSVLQISILKKWC
jgi:hypothetical protein